MPPATAHGLAPRPADKANEVIAQADLLYILSAPLLSWLRTDLALFGLAPIVVRRRPVLVVVVAFHMMVITTQILGVGLGPFIRLRRGRLT